MGVTVGVMFLLSTFFAPLLASVPPWASGPALIIVGAMMMKGIKDIDWADYNAAISAFLTIAVMPLTYSIAYGLIAGIGSWVALWVGEAALKQLARLFAGAASRRTESPASLPHDESDKFKE